jgi:hypothetical protein
MPNRTFAPTTPLRNFLPQIYLAPCPVIQPSLAHDLRNLLATIGLHLEALQRLSGPGGAKASDAAHALLARGATLCNTALPIADPSDTRVP